ncbi:MAG: glycosyl transferase, family 39, partial [Planctomycetota bacterium]
MQAAHAVPRARWICAGFAALQLLLHFAVNATGGYGFFRDEFYYLACSRHLAAGYVDLPPL